MSLTGISGTAAGNSYFIGFASKSVVGLCAFCNTHAVRREVFEIISKEFFHRTHINSRPSQPYTHEARNPFSTHLFVGDYFALVASPAVLCEEEHLPVPHVSVQRPAMRER